MKLSKTSGATVAAAAAAFIMSGAVATPSQAAKQGEVKCVGVNVCKGHSGCQTASNGCKGQNSCKGKGWVAMSEQACKDIGGKVKKGKTKM